MDPLTLAAIAGGVGLIGNYFGAQSSADAARAEASAQMRASQEQQNLLRQLFGQQQAAYQPYQQIGLQAAQQLSTMPTDAGMGAFQGEALDVDRFMDPSMAYQQAQMQRALESSAAARGTLKSGATLKALQQNAAQLAQTGYGNAVNQAMADRNFRYQTYMGQLQQRNMDIARRMQNLQGLMGTGFNATQGQVQAGQTFGGQMGNALGAFGGAQGQYQATSPMMQGQMWQNLGAFGTDLIKAYGGK